MKRTGLAGRSSGVRLLAALLLFPVAAVSSQAFAAPPATSHRNDLRFPNLVALPPFEVYLDEEGSGCDPYETVEQGAQRCLRYDTVVANFGRGPLELRYRADQTGREQELRQRIYARGGTYVERVADRYELHPVHAHFHHANFAMARLWDSDQLGRKLGSRPVRESNKNGFCLVDGENYWKGRKKSYPATYSDPDACYPNRTDDGGLSQVNGLSPGWVDFYQASLTDQYIDVSGLPAGYYLLEIVIDPLNTVKESNETDNAVTKWIVLPEEE